MHTSPANLRLFPGDLAYLSPDIALKIETAVRGSLLGRWYADPHSDAFIGGIPRIEDIPGYKNIAIVDVVVQVYPSAEPRDIVYTIEVPL